jgi:hypothetical protein
MGSPEFSRQDHIERNYEGNESQILLSRLRRPEIKKQVCDLLFKMDSIFAEDGKEEDEEGNEVWPVNQWASSYEDIEIAYDKNLESIQNITNVNFSRDLSRSHNSMEMFPHAINPMSGQKFTTKEMSIIEAHEKGHNIRHYNGPQYDEYFWQGFDLSKITLDPERIKHIRDVWVEMREGSKQHVGIPDSAIIAKVIQANLNGMEVAERMNQLKNYFGFDGSNEFTKAHLDIAREHYIEDTHMDNEMTAFFQAITPETEEKFLELINNSGI